MFLLLLCSSNGKESSCKAGDQGLIPELGSSSGEGNGNSLQYSCPENSMDGEGCQATVHGVPKSQTQLSPHTRMYVFMSWMGEWMDQWIGGWMGGWMDG